MSEKLPNSQNRETVDKAIPSLTKEKITLKNSTKQKTESLK
jgi:hypothetical protein